MAGAQAIELVKILSHKRKAEQEFISYQFTVMEQNIKRRYIRQVEFETEVAMGVALSTIALANGNRRERGPNEPRNSNWWTNGYQYWDHQSFKKRFRVSRNTFQYILEEIEDLLQKEATRMVPHPTTPAAQLALCLYRLAHGCTFLTVGDLFGVAESTANCIFHDVCKAIVECLYDKFVYLPRNPDEWNQELRNFLENWEFPCVGAWDGFHVYISTKLKNFYSFKKRYSVTNMGFIGNNKRFMWAAVGAPGSTHDSRLLKNCNIYSDINNGHVLPNKSLSLSSYGKIPFTTVGDSAFPSHPWLLKPYKECTRVPKQRYFNKRLCSARVVSEHAYGMLKGRWRIIYKKTECHLDNISLLIMTCIALHNICIHRCDPCKPRWRLDIQELNLIRNGSTVDADSDTSKEIIANWLWDIKQKRDSST